MYYHRIVPSLNVTITELVITELFYYGLLLPNVAHSLRSQIRFQVRGPSNPTRYVQDKILRQNETLCHLFIVNYSGLCSNSGPCWDPMEIISKLQIW